MEHRERCDPRMFLTSTLENNSGKGERWRHSIWSSTRGIQDGRRSRFPFPVAGRINRRAVLSPKLVTFWRRKREEHFLLAKPWEKSNFKLEKLNRVFDFLYARFNLTSKVLKICTNIVKQKNDSHALIFVLFFLFSNFLKFWGRTLGLKLTQNHLCMNLYIVAITWIARKVKNNLWLSVSMVSKAGPA